MVEVQEKFLMALANCGISMGALIAVGSVIRTEASAKLMTRKILDEVDNNGKEVTDELVLQILVDLMKEASVETEE